MIARRFVPSGQQIDGFDNKRFDVDDADNIIIDGVMTIHRYTWSLPVDFQENPDDLLYTENDMNKYKSCWR